MSFFYDRTFFHRGVVLNFPFVIVSVTFSFLKSVSFTIPSSKSREEKLITFPAIMVLKDIKENSTRRIRLIGYKELNVCIELRYLWLSTMIAIVL